MVLRYNSTFVFKPFKKKTEFYFCRSYTVSKMVGLHTILRARHWDTQSQWRARLPAITMMRALQTLAATRQARPGPCPN